MRIITNTINGIPGNFIMRDQNWYHRQVTNKGDSEFRIVPEFVNGVEQPQLKQPYTDLEDVKSLLTDSMAMYEILKFAGEKKYSMIVDVSDPIEGFISPARMFYTTISNYIKKNRKTAPDEWFNWLEGGFKAALRKPINCLFIKAVILKAGGRVQVDKDGNPRPTFPGVISMTQVSAIQSLLDGMANPRDPNQPIGVENTAFGDIISCKNGKIVRISSSVEFNPQLKKEQTRYNVEIKETYPLPEILLKNNSKPLHEILNIQTTEWVLARLAETYSPEAVAFVFKDSPYGDKLPESCLRAAAPAANPAQVSMASATPSLPLPMPAPASAQQYEFDEDEVFDEPVQAKTVSSQMGLPPSNPSAGDFPDPQQALQKLMELQKKLRGKS